MERGGNCEGCKYNDGAIEFGHMETHSAGFEKIEEILVRYIDNKREREDGER
jgi:hypothetical protein